MFSGTCNKEFSNVLCEKPAILVELLLELRIVVIQDSDDGKRSVCKKMRQENSQLLQNVHWVTGGIDGWEGTRRDEGKLSTNSFESQS